MLSMLSEVRIASHKLRAATGRLRRCLRKSRRVSRQFRRRRDGVGLSANLVASVVGEAKQRAVESVHDGVAAGEGLQALLFDGVRGLKGENPFALEDGHGIAALDFRSERERAGFQSNESLIAFENDVFHQEGFGWAGRRAARGRWVRCLAAQQRRRLRRRTSGAQRGQGQGTPASRSV